MVFYPIFRVISLGFIPRIGITGTQGKSIFYTIAKLPSLQRYYRELGALASEGPAGVLGCQREWVLLEVMLKPGSPGVDTGHQNWPPCVGLVGTGAHQLGTLPSGRSQHRPGSHFGPSALAKLG